MKFVIVLAALIAVACAQTARPNRPLPVAGDFRNEFDHLIVLTATQRFHELEDFLLKLSGEVADFEKTHNKEEKARILREITIAEGLTTGSKAFFERELKRTDLDLVEKFNFEAALATISILNKDLTALATRVNAIKA